MTGTLGRYAEALAYVEDVDGKIPTAAAEICLFLAIQETDHEVVSYRDQVIASLRADLEKLQAAADVECAGLRKHEAWLVEQQEEHKAWQNSMSAKHSNLTTEVTTLRGQIREQDDTIQTQRVEINRLTAHCQDLTAQLEAANSRPVTLSVQAAAAPFPAGDLAVALADYATSGDGREDLTFVYDNTPAQAPTATDAPAPAAIDWAGLPEEYSHLVDVLTVATANGQIWPSQHAGRLRFASSARWRQTAA